MSLFEALSAEKVYTFDVLPPNGDEITIEMRALSPAQLLEIDRAVPMPKAPFDIQRFEGKIQNIYNYGDPAHVQASTDAQRNRSYQQIVAAWVEVVPGETPAEQAAALADLPSWVVSALVRCVAEVNSVRKEHVVQRSFQSVGDAKK